MNKEPIKVEVYMSELTRLPTGVSPGAYIWEKLENAGVPTNYKVEVAMLGATSGRIKKVEDRISEKCVFTWYPPKHTRWQRFVAWLKRFW